MEEIEKNIIITSSGINTINCYVSNENMEFFKRISKNKKVMVLANAAPIGDGNYIAREIVKDNFLKYTNKVDVVVLDDENIDILLEYDIIYVLGGNINNLLKLNNNPKFKNKLLQFLKYGIYIGESCGSIILCDDVKYYYDIKKGTKKKYDVVLDSYKGLGLVDIKIYPHYNKENDFMKDKIQKYINDNSIDIVCLNDGDIIIY